MKLDQFDEYVRRMLEKELHLEMPLTKEEYDSGWFARLRCWLRQLFCRHELVYGHGIAACPKCGYYWEH